ncbi:MAG: hypothetical protein AAF683_00065 [Pseudomonadota bacterium]
MTELVLNILRWFLVNSEQIETVAGIVLMLIVIGFGLLSLVSEPKRPTPGEQK